MVRIYVMGLLDPQWVHLKAGPPWVGWLGCFQLFTIVNNPMVATFERTYLHSALRPAVQ